MVRPHKERRVEKLPSITHYKPVAIPLRDLDEIVLTIEEMEAIRLADVELLDQGEAAKRMDVSRPTFHRIVNKAHQKIASALWQGCALRIDGGSFRIEHAHRTDLRKFVCDDCSHHWTLPHGTGMRCTDLTCPACNSQRIRREHD